MLRPVHRSHALGVVVVIAAFGCTEHVAEPELVTPVTPPEQFALVEDTGVVRGPLIAEVTVQVPESGAAFGETMLWTHGQIDTTAILEITADIALDNRTLGVSEVVYPGGVIAYYRSDGELVRRSVNVIFFAISPSGIPQLQPLTGFDESATTVVALDTDAPNHGFLLTWSVSEEELVGYNINDGGDPPDCVLLISFLCYGSPSYSPENVSDTPPHGSVQVRVYAAGSGEAVRIQPVDGTMSVRPAGTGGQPLALRVGVFDTGGSPIPNRTVVLTVDGIEQTGGHQHGGTMPNGMLSQTQINTGPSGLAEVRYTPDVFSGKVVIRGTSGNAKPAEDTILIQVPGLVALEASETIRLIGIRDEHPSSHWGTPDMVSALRALADSVHTRYDTHIEVNDMSLEFGGKFDLAADYSRGGSHAEHRVGRNADLRTIIFTHAQLRFIHRTWELLGGSVYDETNTSQPHYHLRF